MYDVIIIGAGPAGLTASIYAKRAGLNSLILENAGIGGQILATYEVDNYPGLKGISGIELGNKFAEHAKKLGSTVVKENVIAIDASGKIKTVVTEGGTYEATNIILATGASHATLGIEHEEEMSGAGVSYCATCDGAFYADADVAVVGGGDVAAEDTIYLSAICKKVYLIHRRDKLRAAESLVKQLESKDNVEIVWNSVIKSLEGDGELEGVMVSDVTGNGERRIDVEGLFVAVGIIPETQLLKGIVDMDEKGYIIAGEDCRTSQSGVYVAGDARKKALRQIVTAVADGANAINSVIEDSRT